MAVKEDETIEATTAGAVNKVSEFLAKMKHCDTFHVS
jgi:hypothetical protein